MRTWIVFALLLSLFCVAPARAFHHKGKAGVSARAGLFGGHERRKARRADRHPTSASATVVVRR